MFVLREREREFADFNKLEKDAMHLFEKGTVARPNRKGVLREIRNIKSSSVASRNDLFKNQTQLVPVTNIKAQPQTKKLNIFDEPNAEEEKHKRLNSLGYSE